MKFLVLPALVLCAACGAGDKNPPSAETDLSQLRIVALSPHLAELTFAAGAGSQLVGVSSYSNFPPEVLQLPIVGDAFRIDQEQLALLQADLLLAWDSGTPSHVLDSLRGNGYRVALIQTRSLADIGRAVEHIGALTGREASARAAAKAFDAKLLKLAVRGRAAEPIRVFYQVSLRPLYTVNGQHYISELIELCGGQNVFAELNELAPMISEEAVLSRDPEVILSAATTGAATDRDWGYWQDLSANRYANHFLIPADAVARATPRVYGAGVAICDALQRGREQRAARRQKAS
ncbi:MAG: ABC transporter substrate-binding protein [Woeseia sp.]|nr:ABC transporter substrate-binding protein [Woeseia sp.]NNL55489.1 ABC transporter substrate-binding protein [Woeseia sp.]